MYAIVIIVVVLVVLVVLVDILILPPQDAALFA